MAARRRGCRPADTLLGGGPEVEAGRQHLRYGAAPSIAQSRSSNAAAAPAPARRRQGQCTSLKAPYLTAARPGPPFGSARSGRGCGRPWCRSPPGRSGPSEKPPRTPGRPYGPRARRSGASHRRRRGPARTRRGEGPGRQHRLGEAVGHGELRLERCCGRGVAADLKRFLMGPTRIALMSDGVRSASATSVTTPSMAACMWPQAAWFF